MRVKICGVTCEDDLNAAVDAGADAVGFITDVSVDTPREIAPGHAADLVAATPPYVTTSLVMMPESPERAVELAATVRPDVIQLHGSFDADQLRFVRAETAAKLVMSVTADDPEVARDYDGVVDALLVDSATDGGAGGTGETHDWETTRELAAALDSSVMLAGGLTPDNVAEAVETVDPYGVDVASGVEREDEGGAKDHDAVRAFVRNAHRAAGRGVRA